MQGGQHRVGRPGARRSPTPPTANATQQAVRGDANLHCKLVISLSIEAIRKPHVRPFLCCRRVAIIPARAAVWIKMVRKKIDSRIRTLIENGVHQRHRSMFVIVGDRGRDQVRADMRNRDAHG